MKIKNNILNMALLFLGMATIPSVSLLLNNTNEKELNNRDEQEVRVASYNNEALHDDNIFYDFDSHEEIINDDGFIIKASKNYASSEFDAVDLVDLDISKDVEVEYEITYIESQGKIILNFYIKDEENIPILDSLKGLVTTNNNGEPDVLFADDEEIIWLRDIVDEELIDNTGWWDNFTKWVSDAFKGALKAIIKGLKFTVNIVVNIVGLENCAKVLDMYKDSYGDYHADFDCWQEIAGYNDLYDFVFDLGSEMLPSKNEFYDENNDGVFDYILYGWKGDYWNLGAGGELAIYRRFGKSEIWHVDKKLAIYMKLKVEYRKNANQNWITIINWDPKDYFANDTSKQKQWWITGFDPQYVNKVESKNQLRVTYEVKFVTKGYSSSFDNKLRDAFKNRWVTQRGRWSYNSSSQTFKYTF